MKPVNRNLPVGIVFLVFAAIVYFQTLELPLQVAIFPKTCAGIIALMGITAIITSFYARKKEDTKPIFTKEIGVVSLALFIIYGLMSFLGFYTSAALFVFFMFLYTEREWKRGSFFEGWNFQHSIYNHTLCFV